MNKQPSRLLTRLMGGPAVSGGSACGDSTLHAISLCGYTKLTRMRLRVLALFLPAFYASGAGAVDYYWTNSNLAGTYPSARAVCTAYVKFFHHNHSTLIGVSPYVMSNYPPRYDERRAVCNTAERANNGTILPGTATVNRSGDSCPKNMTYNPTTTECANDPGKGDPGTCPSPLKADPINTSNGNSIQTEVDSPSSSLSALHFTRTYNSLDGLWRHNHSTHLRLFGTKLALVRADGREAFFTVNSATTPATVTASPTELGRLTKTGDTWLYTAKNSDTYSFDATGRLTRWTNAAGAQHQLSYVNGTVTVTDNLGQSLSFTEDTQHQPLTLSTASLTIKYDYNASQRLSQLTRTRGGQTETRLFHYEKANKPNLLTGITDERGVRYTTWTFDDLDRATSSEHTGGVEHTDIAYNADGSSTITNEFGKKSIYRFVTIDGVKRVSAIEGEALGSCPMSNSTFTYDSRGLLKTQKDNKGNLTTYVYNARGLEESRTEASGTAQARTITTTWHPTLNLRVTVTEPSRITTYSYDDYGSLTGETVTERP